MCGICIQFNKEVGDTLQECKLRVIYVRNGDAEDGLNRNSDANGVSSII